MIRLFTAIEIPDDIREEILGLQIGLPGATWTPFDNLHLTLRFIGEAPEPMVDEIGEALWQIRAEGFPLRLKSIGKFGGESPRSPARSLHLSVEHGEALTRLAAKIEQALQGVGLDAERRKFRPHVTIARLRETPNWRLGDFLAHHAMFSSRIFDVRMFQLYSSTLGRDHSVYDEIDRFALYEPSGA